MNGALPWLLACLALAGWLAAAALYRRLHQRSTAGGMERLLRMHAVTSHMNAALLRTRDSRELFDEAVNIAVRDGGFGAVWMGWIEQPGGLLRSVAWAGEDGHVFAAHDREPTHDVRDAPGLLGKCVRDATPVFDNDMAAHAMPPNTRRSRAVEMGYRSVIVLPLKVNGRVAGLFGMMSKEANFFRGDEERLLTELAGNVAFALEVMEKEQRLNYLAYYHAQTGLPNRALLLERLAHAMQPGARLAVLVVDVRRFRLVNESLGRDAGDALLHALAQRLREASREADHVGHLAGDQFALVLTGCDTHEAFARAISDTLTRATHAGFRLAAQELAVTLAAGAAWYPDDGADAETLLRNAETAMKHAKSQTDVYVAYQPRMNARMAEALAMETRMRRALREEQFVLHYQPKVATLTGDIRGLEALLRWQDPEGSDMPRGDIITVLEETGMIVEAGRWVIARMLRDRAQWLALGLDAPRVAVNVSTIQLRRDDFTTLLREMITAIDPQHHGLEVEITESQVMADVDGAIRTLNTLREMGVAVAIDDFGTGHSSLSYLARLPVNAVKIDQSFVARMLTSSETMSIVSSVISLAHALKLKVVAEGVETAEQRGVLGALGCDEIQGYLVSRPVAADAVAAMLRTHAKLPALA
jgi:diguanylate cyclase (GGDEF)-like protein